MGARPGSHKILLRIISMEEELVILVSEKDLEEFPETDNEENKAVSRILTTKLLYAI